MALDWVITAFLASCFAFLLQGLKKVMSLPDFDSIECQVFDSSLNHHKRSVGGGGHIQDPPTILPPAAAAACVRFTYVWTR